MCDVQITRRCDIPTDVQSEPGEKYLVLKGLCIDSIPNVLVYLGVAKT